jgi:hypothetical protein
VGGGLLRLRHLHSEHGYPSSVERELITLMRSKRR